MNLIHLFDKYFLILMVVQGVFLIFIDPKKFKRDKLEKTALKSKVIGIVFIVFSMTMYILSIYSF